MKTYYRRQPAKAIAVSQTSSASKWAMLLAATGLAFGAATMLRADSHEEITISHGYTNFGELKYPADKIGRAHV